MEAVAVAQAAVVAVEVPIRALAAEEDLTPVVVALAVVALPTTTITTTTMPLWPP